MISPEVVEEIKERNEIEDVISSYVTLKRAGSNMSGLCPFHSEKTPSFTVFLASRSFYCFGCGAGGDVITFVMKAENLDYPGALAFLAKRAGINIVQNSTGSADEGRRRMRILEMNKAAARFFHNTLYSEVGKKGYLYLKEKRKLSDAVIKHFGLGFAPNSFSALTEQLGALGYTREEMTEGFLCGISKKTGNPFDYFRNRVMFPIIYVTGNVIAFGGRVMDDSKPKYLNSSDTPAFKKSKNLFALNFAKQQCSEQMILCEGYMDVIALHAAGFQNAVATLGTAITSEQARLMKRYTKRVVISYDADAAGQRAAERAFDQLSQVGLETTILKMEGAKDPDEYLAKFGAVRFRNILNEGRGHFDFTFDNVLAKYDISLTDDRIRAAHEMTVVIAEITSSVERDVYAHKVAQKLGIPFESLRADIERTIRKNVSAAKRQELRQVARRTEGYGDRVNPDSIKNIRASKSEEGILGILLNYPELLECAKKQLCPEDFFTGFGRRVYEALLKLVSEKGFEFGMLNEIFSEAEISRIMQIRIGRNGLLNDEGVLMECIASLKEAKERNKMNVNEIIEAKRRKKDG